ncbi:MAG: hypothetical protein U1E22_00655 [Coriobacteriia bacterium]|nr:hypothetical protein [Coriobacteriia bacterium]
MSRPTRPPVNDFDNEYEAATRSAYYQGLMDFTTMTRSHGTGDNVYDKLSGDDPNTYQVINLISHGAWQSNGPSEILTVFKTMLRAERVRAEKVLEVDFAAGPVALAV